MAWPVKTREMRNHHMQSDVWNDFRFRDGDVVIASYAKSGTTWAQQIVGQLIFRGSENVDVAALSPWLDFALLPEKVIANLEEQGHRRSIKTHLPVDALVFSPRARYLCLGRDGRDTAWSFYHHYANLTEERRLAMNSAPDLEGPPLPKCSVGPLEFYRSWLAGNGWPFWPFWENVRSWWSIRHLPNVKLVHFNDLKADLAGSIQEIAHFLEIPIEPADFPVIVEHCTFDYMKAHAERIVPRGGASWVGGAGTFMHKGTNGRWRDFLSDDDVQAYESKAIAELGPECAAWLARGTKMNAG